MRKSSVKIACSIAMLFWLCFACANDALGQSLTQVTTPPAFVPGGKDLFVLDLAGTRVGTFPRSLERLSGATDVVLQDGVPMIRATENSELLIRMASPLPENFTIEADVIPKRCCPPPDLTLEGTATINQDVGSAHLLWTADADHGWVAVIGGSADNTEIQIPDELRVTLPGSLARVAVSVEGKRIRFYTNGRMLYDVQAQFARGSYLRVTLGGQSDDAGGKPVYLARLRVATGAPVTVATALPGAPSGATTTPATAIPAAAPTGTTTPMTPPTVTSPAAGGATVPSSRPTSAALPADSLLNGDLLVGVGMSDITGPIAEVVMMGYADGKHKTGGLHTRLFARAFVFGNRVTNKRAVWVSAELGQMFSSVKQGVVAKLAAKYGSLYTDENVMLSATHTHTGPGGYSHHTIYNFSIGGFVRQNYDAIVDGITEAIEQAHNRLAPGNVSVVSHDLIDQTMVQRSKVAFMLNAEALAVPPADEIERDMTLLKVHAGGRPIGAIAFHAVHNTSMPSSNFLVSSDHKGYASYLLEKANGSIAPFQSYGAFVAAFPNGAEGDLSPNLNTSAGAFFTGPHIDPFESAKIIGTRQFNAAFGLLNATHAVDIGADVDFRHKFMLMPGTPVPSSSFTNGAGLKTLCVGAYGVSFAAGAEDGRNSGPFIEGMAFASNIDKTTLDALRVTAVAVVSALMPALGPILGPLVGGTATAASAAFMAASSDQCQFPKPILLPTGFMHWSPEILPFQLIRVGSVAIAGIPGEMTMQAGRRLENAIKAVLLPLGVQHIILTGLANEYSGYITTPEEFVSQQYEGASTLFGRLTFDAYREAFQDLGVALASGKQANSSPPSPDLSAAQIEWAPSVDHDEVPIGETFGQMLLQPTPTVTRGTEVRAIYRSGNPRNDLRRNDSYFRIERDAGGGNWVLVAWDGIPETKLYWSRSYAHIATPNGLIGQACPGDPCYWSTMDVRWVVPADVTPGTYRIRIFGRWKNGVTGQITPYTRTTMSFTVQ